ncbi:MAG: hypothetical protein S4CHLAM102_16000 [Chlamydiia bacterium]|nr:hypothetical protein [Chlamydiia bacterium]
MKIKDFNWSSGIFIIGYHLLLITLLPLYLIYFTTTVTMIVLMIALYFLTGLAVTAGYHRMFSHKAYKTNKTVESIFLFLGLLATQGSALQWSHDHRLHHSFIDKEKDPYSVAKGFWHAHILWMFKKQPPMDPKIVSDLMRSKATVFQDKYYAPLMVLANTAVTLFFGWLLGDYFGAFVFLWLGRVFFLHHCTWFINSLAHYWGHQNYSTEHSAVDNYIICLLTFGEGYHNYHHTFAADYRNGIRWYHFDPTKWLIWTLSKLGMARNLKKVTESKIQEKLVVSHKNILLDKITSSLSDAKEELTTNVNHMAEDLVTKSKNLTRSIELYKRQKCKSFKKEINQLKKNLHKSWKAWKHLNKFIMSLPEEAKQSKAV